MSDFDHYAAARRLISQLSHAGYTAEATSLNAAIEEGATGTEIFMALRFHLSKIIQSVPLKGESQILASRLLAELEDALQ